MSAGVCMLHGMSFVLYCFFYIVFGWSGLGCGSGVRCGGLWVRDEVWWVVDQG